MRILLVGSGGRRHALARTLRLDPSVTDLIIAPGNPGTASLGENVPVDILDGEALVAVAREREVDLVVVGPEAPLVAGVADDLRDAGIPVFGPSREAARLEGSKAFAKEIGVCLSAYGDGGCVRIASRPSMPSTPLVPPTW